MHILYPQPDDQGITETKELLEARTGRPVSEEDAKQVLEYAMRFQYLLRR